MQLSVNINNDSVYLRCWDSGLAAVYYPDTDVITVTPNVTMLVESSLRKLALSALALKEAMSNE